MLRPGNAGSNTASRQHDHIAVLTAAIGQVPTAHRRKMLIRADGAGASHGLLDWLTGGCGHDAKRGRTVEYSVGYAVTDKVRDAIARVPKQAWQPAITAQGEPREHGDVVEITDMLSLSTWPTGMRILIRREHPHPGAALTLFEDADGWRYQAVATNTPVAKGGQVASLEARHRAHAMHQHVETRIRHAKDTGIGRFPSREYAINQAWLIATSIAADLIAWLRLLALPAKLTACEPKALRYRLLHVPARLTHGARKRHTPVPGHMALGQGRPVRVHRDPRPDPVADLRLAPSPVHSRASTTGDPPAAPRGTPPHPKDRTHRQRQVAAVTDPGELARLGGSSKLTGQLVCHS